MSTTESTLAGLTLTLEADAPTSNQCKGRYYRYLETAFIGKGGRVVSQQELRPLKKISCPGCEHCGWEQGDLQEGVANEGGAYLEFVPELKSGDIARLVFVEDGRDWESGHLDDWHLKVVPATEFTKMTEEELNATPLPLRSMVRRLMVQLGMLHAEALAKAQEMAAAKQPAAA